MPHQMTAQDVIRVLGTRHLGTRACSRVYPQRQRSGVHCQSGDRLSEGIKLQNLLAISGLDPKFASIQTMASTNINATKALLSIIRRDV